MEINCSMLPCRPNKPKFIHPCDVWRLLWPSCSSQEYVTMGCLDGLRLLLLFPIIIITFDGILMARTSHHQVLLLISRERIDTIVLHIFFICRCIKIREAKSILWNLLLYIGKYSVVKATGNWGHICSWIFTSISCMITCIMISTFKL